MAGLASDLVLQLAGSLRRANRHEAHALVTAPVTLARLLLMRHIVMPREIEAQARSGVLSIDVCSNQGLGAKLRVAVEVMAYCDARNIRPHFRFTFPWSSVDVFHCLFSPKQPVPQPSKTLKLMKKYWLPFHPAVDAELTLSRSHDLFFKYFSIAEDVSDEVDAFCANELPAAGVLAVHYRGLDKFAEAAPVTYDHCVRNIHHFIERHSETEAVFLSSDDAAFIAYARQQVAARPIVTREDVHRSESGAPVHLDRAVDSREVARDALVNCLIMARAAALIKTSSYLSAFAKVFNPHLPVVMLNKPHNDWFPEREIVRNLLYDPIS